MPSIQNFTEAFLHEKGKFISSVTGTLYLTSPHVSLLCQHTVWSCLDLSQTKGTAVNFYLLPVTVEDFESRVNR